MLSQNIFFSNTSFVPFLFVGLLWNPLAGFGQSCQFAQTSSSSGGSQPFSIRAGDLDDDGDLDLVVGNRSGFADIGVLFNNGNGTFSIPDTYSVAPPLVEDVELGDLDGDGDLDLVSVGSNGSSRFIEVLINTGNGEFYQCHRFGFLHCRAIETVTEISIQPKSVALGDFDGDSDLDVALYGIGLSILSNLGDGTFGPETFLGSFPANIGSAIKAADVDGDSDVDLISIGGNQSTVWLNDGGGTFKESPIFGCYGRSLAIDDIDGDGDVDFVVNNFSFSNPDPPSVDVYLNDGIGGFANSERIFVGDSFSRGIEIGDINGDSFPDIVTEREDPDVAMVLFNRGDGSFSHTPLEEPVSSVGPALVVADLNQDGINDVVITVVPGGSGMVSVLLNQGCSKVSGAVVTDGDDLLVTGTPLDDLIEIRAVGSDIRILINGADQGVFEIPSGTLNIVAADGSDEITLAAGLFVDAIIDGGDGDDVIRSGSGSDLLFGGSGNDLIFARVGDDMLDGGDGDDMLFGQAGNDVLFGGHGDDALDGGFGIDTGLDIGELLNASIEIGP